MAIVLKNIEDRKRNLRRFGDFLIAVGFKVKLNLIRNWDKGKGGDGATFKPLTDKYREFKKSKGRAGIPNMKFSGRLRAGLTVTKLQVTGVSVGFFDAEKPKAEGNVETRSNIMKINDKFKNKMIAFLFKKLTT